MATTLVELPAGVVVDLSQELNMQPGERYVAQHRTGAFPILYAEQATAPQPSNPANHLLPRFEWTGELIAKAGESFFFWCSSGDATLSVSEAG